jgi:hypothetical protein
MLTRCHIPSLDIHTLPKKFNYMFQISIQSSKQIQLDIFPVSIQSSNGRAQQRAPSWSSRHIKSKDCGLAGEYILVIEVVDGSVRWALYI